MKKENAFKNLLNEVTVVENMVTRDVGSKDWKVQIPQ